MANLEDLKPNQEEKPADDDTTGAPEQPETSLDSTAEPGPEEDENESKKEEAQTKPSVHPSFMAEQMFLEDEEEDEEDDLRGFDDEPELDRDVLEKLYDDTMKDLKEGNIVTGRIIEVDDSSVLIDIGYKSEGVLQRQELEDSLFPVNAELGQEVEVVLEAIEDQDGRVMLSKRRADRLRFWDELKNKFQNNEPIEGTIISRKRGGYTVNIQGIKAFLPGSQLDLHPVRDMDEFVGCTYPMKILNLQVEGTHRNIVLSRRAVLEADLKDRIEATLAKLQEGRIVKGIVKNITDWGVFIDLGGIDGLLHRTDISWGRTEHPSQYFKVGDEVEVIVLRFDRERNQVSLGYKQRTPDPWQHVEERYYEGARIKGRVVSLKQYGAFVELEESVQGLLHVSEMSWTKRIEHPSQLIAESEMIDVVVLRVDSTERKISLGLKQLTEDPWKQIADLYPVDSRVSGIVREISNIGAKVEIDEDIIGFLHRSNITWSRHMRHPADVLELGDSLDLIVLEADPESHKLSLGLKQIRTDPWEGIEQDLKPDMVISGRVINILDFGAFVEVRPGVEGLVHISEIASKRISHPGQVLDQNQEVRVKVISVNERDHRLSLSIRECLDETEEQEMLEKLKKAQEREAAKSAAVKRQREAREAKKAKEQKEGQPEQALEDVEQKQAEAKKEPEPEPSVSHEEVSPEKPAEQEAVQPAEPETEPPTEEAAGPMAEQPEQPAEAETTTEPAPAVEEKQAEPEPTSEPEPVPEPEPASEKVEVKTAEADETEQPTPPEPTPEPTPEPAPEPTPEPVEVKQPEETPVEQPQEPEAVSEPEPVEAADVTAEQPEQPELPVEAEPTPEPEPAVEEKQAEPEPPSEPASPTEKIEAEEAGADETDQPTSPEPEPEPEPEPVEAEGSEDAPVEPPQDQNMETAREPEQPKAEQVTAEQPEEPEPVSEEEVSPEPEPATEKIEAAGTDEPEKAEGGQVQDVSDVAPQVEQADADGEDAKEEDKEAGA